ncbi:MbeB family mobilization protein [Enterobacter intestinihominis]
MNSLLTLAKDLEQKSKAQQQGTGPYRQPAIHQQPDDCQRATAVKRY